MQILIKPKKQQLNKNTNPNQCWRCLADRSLERVDQVAPHRTYYGGSEMPSLTPWHGRKCDFESVSEGRKEGRKEGSSLPFFALRGRAGYAQIRPESLPQTKFPFHRLLLLLQAKKPRSNRLGKCSQNHPACLTCHPERSNSSRCALNLSPSLSLSLSILHRLALFRNGIED